ncbi:MAG: response regulator transcription factor [Lachnospiraceae bacterium]|nr:response regulator transcription factor [Lachnospiraceae bacterium]MBR7019441.1 response regulator transcription factor [Lachnospiraceae bacterium]
MCRILLAEDNNGLREVMTDYLSDNGFTVDAVADGMSAWDAFCEHDYRLVLLDVMMPKMNGFDVCRRIRAKEDVPILFLTARVQEEDQLLGYSLGADEYIVKPFSLPVLVAKCKAILERAAGRTMTENVFTMEGLSVNFVTCKATVDGRDIDLQALDYRLLRYFIANRGRVLTREQILDRIWGLDYEGSDRVVDTHIKKLRKALGSYGSHIETVIKEGYRFV